MHDQGVQRPIQQFQALWIHRFLRVHMFQRMIRFNLHLDTHALYVCGRYQYQPQMSCIGFTSQRLDIHRSWACSHNVGLKNGGINTICNV